MQDAITNVINKSDVQGLYLEGFVTTSAQGTQTTGQATPQGGVRLELEFPRGISNSYTVGSQGEGNATWGVDVTWQP